jgi:molecular chaperone DnaK
LLRRCTPSRQPAEGAAQQAEPAEKADDVVDAEFEEVKDHK